MAQRSRKLVVAALCVAAATIVVCAIFFFYAQKPLTIVDIKVYNQNIVFNVINDSTDNYYWISYGCEIERKVNGNYESLGRVGRMRQATRFPIEDCVPLQSTTKIIFDLAEPLPAGRYRLRAQYSSNQEYVINYLLQHGDKTPDPRKTIIVTATFTIPDR